MNIVHIYLWKNESFGKILFNAEFDKTFNEIPSSVSCKVPFDKCKTYLVCSKSLP
jgi:hypothetical protein